MARVRVGSSRPASLSVRERRRSLRASLTPAPLLTSYEMTQGSPGERYFTAMTLQAGATEWGGDAWPCETYALAVEPAPEFRDGSTAVYRFGDALALVALSHGWCYVRVAAPSQEAVATLCQAFRGAYPATYATQVEDSAVPITFWSMSKWGAQPRMRRVESAAWPEIEGNYTAAVRDELAEVMGWQDGPGRDGQLMLWQGPPGTAKTWALRALASEWAPWAEFHYITDPDTFFVEDASYMVDVLLTDSYEAIDADSGDVYSEEQAGGKWRVLILEDTGELLSARAKEKYGQGLSRLLNVVDGMIGQGLRVIALVTTNDELGELAPAVTRPGRCASKIVFGPLSGDEAAAWLAAHGDDSTEVEGPMTAAELFAAVHDGQPAITDEEPAVEPVEPLVASVEPPDVWAEVARVAAEHQPDEPAYGQTAYDADRRVVLWVGWDGTGNEEAASAEAAFLAIDGVDAFEWEAEALPSGWWSAAVVYPDSPPPWVLEPPAGSDEAALEEVLTLAGEPIHVPVALTRQDVAEAVQEALAAHVPAPATPDPLTLLASAVEAIGRAAERPMPPIHVHLGQPDLSVHTHAADQRFDIALPAATVTSPDVHVHVPEGPAPQIDVHVPEQAAPIVTVEVEPTPIENHNHVEVPQPRPTVAVPIRDADGTIVRVEHRSENG